MRGLNEIITANAATSQMKPESITKRDKEKLLSTFCLYMKETQGFDNWTEQIISEFVTKYRD